MSDENKKEASADWIEDWKKKAKEYADNKFRNATYARASNHIVDDMLYYIEKKVVKPLIAGCKAKEVSHSEEIAALIKQIQLRDKQIKQLESDYMSIQITMNKEIESLKNKIKNQD